VGQLWLFLAGPIVGALLALGLTRRMFDPNSLTDDQALTPIRHC